MKRVQSTPATVETLLTSLAWPFAARFVQPTGKVVADQIKQLFKLLLTHVVKTWDGLELLENVCQGRQVKTWTASGTGPTMLAEGPLLATAVAGAAGARIREEEANTALRRTKRARALDMVKDEKQENSKE